MGRKIRGKNKLNRSVGKTYELRLKVHKKFKKKQTQKPSNMKPDIFLPSNTSDSATCIK